jgi:hypothetical protein
MPPAARRIGTARERAVVNGAGHQVHGRAKVLRRADGFRASGRRSRRGLRADRAPVSPLTAAGSSMLEREASAERLRSNADHVRTATRSRRQRFGDGLNGSNLADRRFRLMSEWPKITGQPKTPAKPARTCLTGVLDSIPAAQHALGIFRRALQAATTATSRQALQSLDQNPRRGGQTSHIVKSGTDWPREPTIRFMHDCPPARCLPGRGNSPGWSDRWHATPALRYHLER